MRPRRSLTPRPRTTKTPKGANRSREAYDAERTSAMRKRLLEAAFESLHELGYARTTTVEVCRRAGVQRGTLLHHFPDREALVVAALEHLFERRLSEFSRELAGLEKGSAGKPHRPDARTIDLLWRTVNKQSTVAWIELVVAARSEPSLSRKLRVMTRAFDARIKHTFAEMFPSSAKGASAVPRAGVSFVFALMNGLVLDRLGGFEDHAPEVLAGLKQIVTLLGPDGER